MAYERDSTHRPGEITVARQLRKLDLDGECIRSYQDVAYERDSTIRAGSTIPHSDSEAPIAIDCGATGRFYAEPQNGPLRIVIVEDDTDDAELVLHALKNGGLDVALCRVDSESAYLAALDPVPDLVISDYFLPLFGADGALGLLKARELDIPFIVVSGLITAEEAISLMRAGARDYVFKHDLARLVPVIQRELDHARTRAERRRAEAALRQSERRFRLITEGLPQLVWTARADGVYDYLSPQWVRYTGIEDAAHLGSGWLKQLHPDDRAATIEAWRRAMATCTTYDVEYRLRGWDGNYRWFKTCALPLRDEAGRIVKWFGSCTDVHDQRLAEAALRESDARLQAAMSYAGIGSWEVDLLTGRITESEQIGPIYGKPAGWTHPDCASWRRMLHPEDREDVTALHEAALAGAAEGYRTEYRVLWEDGVTVRWVESTVTILRDASGKAVRAIGLDRDITERKHAEARIESLASYNHDPLTGLPNRALLVDLLAQAIAQSGRDERRLALLFIDLDRFKHINDSLGHHIGDLLLRQVSTRLKACARASDIVARLGGDEFVVVLTGLQQPRDAAQVAKKIVACVARPYRMERHTLYTSCSVGVCIYPDDEADAQALMKGADTVMYHAKEKGRNQYQFFSREIGARAIDRLELENALWRAIKRKEFELHYQPCIDLDTGVITGVEALLRWRHPKLGLLPPAHFIPLAEETGLIVPIGQWVLRAACEQLKAWQALGIEDLRVAVNLSARQFWQLDLARQILATLSSCELQAHLLELEITESMAMQDPEGAKEILLQLERMGLSLTIDDFGTGYSSLTCLNRFPIHCLKIDRSFINGILKDGSDAAITKATIALAKSLNLRVIAEGVETKAQQLFLRQAGCDSAQGFLFGSPVLAAELTPQLRRA